MEPSEKVHDTVRKVSAGKVDIPTNSKPYNDNFHIDRSRLGEHYEYDPEAKNDYGGKGNHVRVPNSIRRNAIGSMGDLRARATYKDETQPGNNTGSEPCCVPEPYPPYSKNPMFTKRKGE